MATRRNDLSNVAALLDLCDAQQNTIERLQRALDEHDQSEGDRRMLQRMLAHELRTPLTAVIGLLHTMRLESTTPEQREDFRGKALRQAEHLNDMIEDILDLSTPHDPAVARAPQEWVDVGDLVDDVRLAVSASMALDRLVMEVPEGLAIRTIPSRVRQILVNLVVNAAKYSPPGAPVRVVATREEGSIVFDVLDEGPGIPAGTVEDLFEAGRQGDEASEGVGLGLYLVRSLVQSLRGTVELLPREGGGTVARVELPQRRAEDLRRPARSRPLHAVPSSDEPGA